MGEIRWELVEIRDFIDGDTALGFDEAGIPSKITLYPKQDIPGGGEPSGACPARPATAYTAGSYPTHIIDNPETPTVLSTTGCAGVELELQKPDGRYEAQWEFHNTSAHNIYLRVFELNDTPGGPTLGTKILDDVLLAPDEWNGSNARGSMTGMLMIAWTENGGETASFTVSEEFV